MSFLARIHYAVRIFSMYVALLLAGLTITSCVLATADPGSSEFEWELFSHTHSLRGRILPVANDRGMAIIYFWPCNTGREQLDITVGSAAIISISCHDFVVVESEPGSLPLTVMFHYDKRMLDRLDTVSINRKIVIEKDKKIYIRVGYEAYFDAWDEKHGVHIEQWKPPYAYINLCSRGSHVCEDSPWQPEPGQLPQTGATLPSAR